MIRAKKSLGQNFLNSKKIVGDIVTASEITSEDTVLEIGPGKGILTQALLQKAKKVIAIEKDDRLIELLHEKFHKEIENEKLELVHDDALDFDPVTQINETYALVANIPYYITGMVIQKFLESDLQPKTMTLMVQKEVADRIVSTDEKESILSISVKVYGTPKKVSKIPKRFFSPAPKVDSAILVIRDISKAFFNGISEEQFFAIIKTGFSHKRKLLINNLELLYPKSVLTDTFASCGVLENTRAENMSKENWKCFVKKVSN